VGNWSSDAKAVFVTLPRRDFTVVSDMDFARNPTGNNRDVFRDPAGGPLTSTGHLRDSATSRQRSRSPFARECRYTSRAVHLDVPETVNDVLTMVLRYYNHCQFTYSRTIWTYTSTTILTWSHESCTRFATIDPPNRRESRIYDIAYRPICSIYLHTTRYISPFTRELTLKLENHQEVVAVVRSCAIAKSFLYLWIRAFILIETHIQSALESILSQNHFLYTFSKRL